MPTLTMLIVLKAGHAQIAVLARRSRGRKLRVFLGAVAHGAVTSLDVV
ncbi:MAG: hypothetical protein JWO60_3446 [Frankiales bacterium]|nr:hypothetical protein [Frankiales bacterium]